MPCFSRSPFAESTTSLHRRHDALEKELVRAAIQRFIAHERQEVGLSRRAYLELPSLRTVLMQPQQHDPAVRRALALGSAATLGFLLCLSCFGRRSVVCLVEH